jgi:hypothetical protein
MSFIKTIERSILTCDEKYKRETLNLLLHSVSLFHCATKKKKELKKKNNVWFMYTNNIITVTMIIPFIIMFGSCVLQQLYFFKTI